MGDRRDDWPFGEFFGAGFGPRFWSFCWPEGGRGPRRRRQQVFESGEVKYVILRLLREKPRHGYEIIKALEEQMGGGYTPSPGTVYPTLQLLEDQGFVRAVESEGKRVYHITPEGEAFLEQHRDVTDEILERVRDTVRGFASGRIGEVNQAFARVARATYKQAWRIGPDDPALGRVAEVLRRAADEIEALKERAAQASAQESGAKS
jgi:DNA-binding PadR family transcriptional regulator